MEKYYYIYAHYELDTGELFNIRSHSSIVNNLSGHSQSAGKYSDGTKIRWKFV